MDSLRERSCLEQPGEPLQGQGRAESVSGAGSGRSVVDVSGIGPPELLNYHLLYEQPDQAAEFFTQEMGVKPPYARRGVDYFTRNKIFPIDGAVTLDGLKMNIEVQARDGVLKELLPSPERYVDLSYPRQAQKKLGFSVSEK